MRGEQRIALHGDASVRKFEKFAWRQRSRVRRLRRREGGGDDWLNVVYCNGL
jgi:hypothetical protein